MTEKLDLSELERLCAAATGVYFTSDEEASPYCGKIVRVWHDGTGHWAEGYTIVTEEPEADDHPEDRKRLVESANALPALLSRLRALERVAAETRVQTAVLAAAASSHRRAGHDYDAMAIDTVRDALDAALKEAGL